MIIIPTLLIAHILGQRAGRIDARRRTIMVSQGGKNGTGQKRLEQMIHTGLGVFQVGLGLFEARVMRDEIARVDGPGERAPLALSAGARQGSDCLQCRDGQIVRTIALEGAVKGSRSGGMMIGGSTVLIGATAQVRGRALGLGTRGVPSIQVNIREMENLDALPARSGRESVGRFRFGEQAVHVERVDGRPGTRSVERPTHVIAVLALNIGVGIDLRPGGPEGILGIGLLALGVGAEAELFAHADEKVRDAGRNHAADRLDRAQGVLALGAHVVDIAGGDVGQVRFGELRDQLLLPVGQEGGTRLGGGQFHRRVSGRGDVEWIGKIGREDDIVDGILDDRLRLLCGFCRQVII